jgi:hypothetical protein
MKRPVCIPGFYFHTDLDACFRCEFIRDFLQTGLLVGIPE